MLTPSPQFLCLAIWEERGDSNVHLVSQEGAIDLERREGQRIEGFQDAKY